MSPLLTSEKPLLQTGLHGLVKSMVWKGGSLDILDQRLLPHQKITIPCKTSQQVARCIREMAVRGAPAIGDAAAFGVALAAQEKSFSSAQELLVHIQQAIKVLAATRPTAVNLFWALDRMGRQAQKASETNSVPEMIRRLEQEAKTIFQQDLSANRAIGVHGAKLLKKSCVLLTHCNAGALATAGYGTATSVIYQAHEQKKVAKVFVDETRPYLQGARLTIWELMEAGVPCELITDNMAGHFMAVEGVDAVIVGADRVAANGDVANKIGTYSLAILAKHHSIPFYVAAPLSTIDLKTKSGQEIPIEERSSQEVTVLAGVSIAPAKARARHPAFDVTPSELVTGIITERGVVRAPYTENLKKIISAH